MRKLAFLILVVMLSGCSLSEYVAVKPTPKKMKTEGAVIFMTETTPFQIPFSRVDIDGKYLIPVGHEAQFVLLAPGKHKLTGFSQYGQSSDTFYPIERDFTIKKGQVTSLGVLLIELGLKNQFHYLWVNGQKRILADIESQYPVLLPAGHKLDIAPFQYVNHNLVLQYRQHALKMNHRVSFLHPLNTMHDYVGGALGTLAHVRRGSDGKVRNYTLLHTGSYAYFNKCTQLKGEVACLLADGKTLYEANRHAGSYHKLPDTAVWTGIFNRGGDHLLLSSDANAFALSDDGGRTWTTNTHFRSDDHTLYAAKGDDGLYFYSKKSDHTIIYVSDRKDTIRKLPIPGGFEEYQALVETQQGLFYGPEFNLMEDSTFAFLPQGSKTWKERKVPQAECLGMTKVNDTTLQVNCGTGPMLLMQSTDAGRHWSVTKKQKSG